MTAATRPSGSSITRACASIPPTTRLSAIPTQAQLNGDLSTVAQASIHDPLTGQPFPNKQIPALSRRSYQPGISILYAQSHVLPGALGPGVNLVTPISATNNFDQFTVKFDEQINSNSHAFARYTFNDLLNSTPGLVPQYTTPARRAIRTPCWAKTTSYAPP